MPQGARSGKAALSTAIRGARVTSSIWQSSPVKTMAIRFVRSVHVPVDSPLVMLAPCDSGLAELIGAETRKGLAAARK
jgi:hypothetical protein